MMTMDVHRRCVETSPSFLGTGAAPESSQESDSSSLPSKPVKRSFDVAFLMAPDDTMKKRQHQEELKQQLKLVTTASLMPRYSPPVECEKNLDIPLGLLMPTMKNMKDDSEERPSFTKSAFTKVASPGRFELTVVSPPVPVSPTLSSISGDPISPEISFQERVSPTAVRRSPVGQYFSPRKQLFNGKGASLSPAYLYQQPKIKFVPPSSPERQPQPYLSSYPKAEEKATTGKGKYSGDVLPYGGLPVPYGFPSSFPPPSANLLTAAANVTAALLPPSFAALTLPAQNVCAKCNVSFRMTSDLVYHMRSQHKNDSICSDSARRRREQEKLRCPVCNEAFRERHHLTRHMTAHQDKEGDCIDDEDDTGARRRVSSQAK